jgi:NDP-sugar pyrophosphorylase family protein
VIPALVLTAGLATRLRPLSFVRAKAALPIAGEPLARRILRNLRAQGLTDAVLNLHHLPHTLTAQIGDGGDLGMRVRYSWEMPVLGSAGGPRHALSLLVPGSRFQGPGSVPGSGSGSVPGSGSGSGVPGSGVPGSTFLIVNGDTLTDVDIAAVIDGHRRSGALVTMAVVPNTQPEKYGGAVLEDEIVTGFVRRGSTQRSFHFIGVQVAEAEAFAALPDNTPHESVGALYPELMAARRGAVRAHVCDAEFFDIGTPADYLDTALLLARRDGAPAPHGAGSRIHPSARIEDSILWDVVEVGEGALLRQCVVTDGVRVPADTSWTGVTIRRAGGELAPGERRIEDLAIATL